MRRFGLVAIIITILCGLLTLLTALLWQVARPITRDDGVIIAPFYLQTGNHDGDLVVTGQNIIIESAARVTGNISIIGQQVEIGGRIGGDVIVLADEITLLPEAVIGGSMHLLGGEATIGGRVAGDLVLNVVLIDIQNTARIAGEIRPCNPALITQLEYTRNNLIPCNSPDVFAPLIALREGESPMQQVEAEIELLLVVMGGVLFIGMTALLVTIMPLRISRVEEAIRLRPLGLLGVGAAIYMLMAGVAIGAVIALAAFPPLALVAVPVSLLSAFSAGALTLLGLPTIALMLGDALLLRLGARQPPLIAAVVGAAVLYPLFAVGGVLWIGGAAVAALGVGGALVTRWGEKPVQRAYFIQG